MSDFPGTEPFFVGIRIRIVFVWIRIHFKVRSGDSSVTNFLDPGSGSVTLLIMIMVIVNDFHQRPPPKTSTKDLHHRPSPKTSTKDLYQRPSPKTSTKDLYQRTSTKDLNQSLPPETCAMDIDKGLRILTALTRASNEKTLASERPRGWTQSRYNLLCALSPSSHYR